ncbi:hypothetical protein OG339_27975 [Streptosporangium sp. NBC_01495]|uniref:hypothetical protein n=1 Tax=Streptosporangium sp. NBC_01495 TaxID=2903899 RepID=UPI002E2EAB78|nr:hypothetical protein [Streptosporangium sp. NBC_01495]
MSKKRVLTAAQHGYRSASAPVDAGADKVSRTDFSLTAGLLVLKSGDVSEKTPLGKTVKRQLMEPGSTVTTTPAHGRVRTMGGIFSSGAGQEAYVTLARSIATS